MNIIDFMEHLHHSLRLSIKTFSLPHISSSLLLPALFHTVAWLPGKLERLQALLPLPKNSTRNNEILIVISSLSKTRKSNLKNDTTISITMNNLILYTYNFPFWAEKCMAFHRLVLCAASYVRKYFSVIFICRTEMYPRKRK
jgi:hypothetical protein